MPDPSVVPATGWTAQELADHLGVGLRTVRRYTRIWPHHKVGTRPNIRFMAGDVAQIRRMWFTSVNQPEPPTVAIRRLRNHKQRAS